MKQQQTALIAAGIVALIYFYGALYGHRTLMLITKALPVLILAFHLPIRSKFSKKILMGLIFSAIGDFLLQINESKLFIFGLTAFLIAHIFYIIAFVEREKKLDLASLPFFVMIGAAELYFLYPNLGEAKIPVLLYMTTILVMLWRAFVQRKAGKYAIYAFIGAALFVISDSVIAFDKFYHHDRFSFWIIMITYWLAQGFIYYSAYKSDM